MVVMGDIVGAVAPVVWECRVTRYPLNAHAQIHICAPNAHTLTTSKHQGMRAISILNDQVIGIS